MKRSYLILIVSIVICMISQDVMGQFFRNQGYWKKFRAQVYGNVGAANFLGELGGRDQVGSDFIWDLETKVFKPALTLGFRYNTSKNFSLRAQFSYAQLSGDDALTAEPFRFNRNLHFRSHTYELALLGEVIISDIRPGHTYDLAGVRGQKPRAANLYAFGGIAGIKFNPQAKAGENWYDLQPFGTEGQNLRGGADPYKLVSLAIPLGIGYRWQLGSVKNLMIGIEIGHRITFTDYIDDVSTVYHDQTALAQQFTAGSLESALAQHFADPSNGFYIDDAGGLIPLNSTGTGQQRGDPEDNDAYLFAQATVSYALNKQPYRKVYKRSKKGKRIVF